MQICILKTLLHNVQYNSKLYTHLSFWFALSPKQSISNTNYLFVDFCQALVKNVYK